MMPRIPLLSPATTGAAYVWRGLKRLTAPELRGYVLAPLLINGVLYGLAFWIAAHFFSQAMQALIPTWLDWLRWLLWPVFAMLLLVVAFFTFGLVANLMGAPFYAMLAEKAHRLATGQTAAVAASSWLREWGKSIAQEAARMSYIALLTLPLLPLFLVPVVNLAASLLWLLLSAWSLALEYLAYPLELRGLNFAEQRTLLRRQRVETLAFGGAVMLGLAIPVLNVLIPPAAIVGATFYFAERAEKIKKTGP